MKNRSMPILIPVAFIISLMWIISAVYLAYELRTDDGWTHPNTIGDFLAGVFAPLAFAWLAIAVFLQQQELFAQRTQLAQNGKALELQAMELRNTVEELAKQTKKITASTNAQAVALTRDGYDKEQQALAKFLFQELLDVEVRFKDGESCKLVANKDAVVNLEKCISSNSYYQYFTQYLIETRRLKGCVESILENPHIAVDLGEINNFHWFGGNGTYYIDSYYDAISNLPGYSKNKLGPVGGGIFALYDEFEFIVGFTRQE